MAFSAEWLGLREPADRAARDGDLLSRAAECAGGSGVVLDLGSGTGSTARAFAARGFGTLRWRLLDNDPALLEVARAQHPAAKTVVADLSRIDAIDLSDVALVTCSALLDLMPRDWVSALASRLLAEGIPFYACLSYDGQMRWTPALESDDEITERFNAHQQGDKGIGAALGPRAGDVTARIFADLGFDVTCADSPWILGPDRAALQDALLDGIGQAAGEAGHPAARDWTERRRAMIAASQVVIGHTDVLALPPAAGS